MSFLDWLKVKKGIDTEGKTIADFMDDYYDEYLIFLKGTKDGCSPK